MSVKSSGETHTTVAIVGGGVAGSTAAVHLAELGVKIALFEKGPGLVNGPPICHLHAGGNLYRDISEQQCIDLLKQSVESIRLFPHTVNKRPTVLAVPLQDKGSPDTIIERLKTIRQAYRQLVESDSRNQVLGDADDYFTTYTREQLESLKQKDLPQSPSSFDEWMIPFARYTNLDKLKFPVAVVHEYGWSVFRLAASAMLALEQMDNCSVYTHSTVTETNYLPEKDEWQIEYTAQDGRPRSLRCKYLVNACGYQTGKIDDQINAKRQRMVEFKSAYVARWKDHQAQWPEVIFHGERGTPRGMAQFTPYGNGVFQLHGMTDGITLFEQGLVASTSESSQPQLPQELQNKLDTGWNDQAIIERTRRAIDYLYQYIPCFGEAEVESKPLFGAQQIPGNDASLRAADVSFEAHNYARIEVVKGSSALEAVNRIAEHWSLISSDLQASGNIEEVHPVSMHLNSKVIEQKAIELAVQRGYPEELAQVSGEI